MPTFSWLQRFFFRSGSRGETGERLAADFLKRERGFKVVTRNWRSPRDRRAEIDLVCRDGDVLVFVEVKTRTAGALVPGFYAVGKRKKRAMLRACKTYLGQMTMRPRTFRFDVVEVTLPANSTLPAPPPEVRHFENIPLFPKHYRG